MKYIGLQNDPKSGHTGLDKKVLTLIVVVYIVYVYSTFNL